MMIPLSSPSRCVTALWTALSIIFVCSHSLSLAAENGSAITIAVSVPPYVDIVQGLIGDEGTVEAVVGSSMSSHTYEPTPKDMARIQRATIWFGIGEPFEAKMLKSLRTSMKSSIQYIDLRQQIAGEIRDMVGKYPSLEMSCSCPHHSSSHGPFHDKAGKAHHHHHIDLRHVDPHIWMSPYLMAKQIDIMAKEIKRHIPSIDPSAIDERKDTLISKCTALLKKAEDKLLPEQGKAILAAHPAYGYLLAPFGIRQYSIEEEGKEPSPQALTRLISLAQAEGISVVFIQSQYPSKGAEVIAHKVLQSTDTEPRVVALNPYSQEYFSSMDTIIDTISGALSHQRASQGEGIQ